MSQQDKYWLTQERLCHVTHVEEGACLNFIMIHPHPARPPIIRLKIFLPSSHGRHNVIFDSSHMAAVLEGSPLFEGSTGVWSGDLICQSRSLGYSHRDQVVSRGHKNIQWSMHNQFWRDLSQMVDPNWSQIPPTEMGTETRGKGKTWMDVFMEWGRRYHPELDLFFDFQRTTRSFLFSFLLVRFSCFPIFPSERLILAVMKHRAKDGWFSQIL